MHKFVILLCAALPFAVLPIRAAAVIQLAPAVVYVRPCPPDEPDAEPEPAECGLWVADRDGTQRQITSSPDDRAPSWSPDGTLIAFGREGDGLYTVRPDGTGLRRIGDAAALSDPFGRPKRPAWSPDARRLAVTSPATQDKPPAVVVMHRDGTSRRVLAEGVHSPSWSPDGNHIAVMSSVAALLAVYDVSGNQVSTSPGPQPRSPEDFRSSEGVPSWSPDGTHILFTAQQYGGRHANYHGFVAPRGGGQPTAIGEAYSNGRAWAPDSQKLVTWRTSNYDIVSQRGDLDLRERHPDGTYPVAGQVGAEDSWFDRDPRWLEDDYGLVYARVRDDGHRMQIVHSLAGVTRVLAQVAFDFIALAHGTGHFDVAPVVKRHAGPSRGETAAAVSRSVWEQADTVVIAPSDSYAEALLAAPLAGSLDAPTLLAHSFGLPFEAELEIRRLGAERAVVVDPDGRLDENIELQLRDRAGVDEVVWLDGDNVFAAAAEVARQLPGEHAYLVEGVTTDPARGWPDAVSVSALAAHQQDPVLYTLRDILPEETRAALRDRERVTIVGGTAAVSGKVEQELVDMGLQVDRLSGAERYATSTAVADASLRAGLSAEEPWIVTGTNYPDALAAGPAAAKAGAVLLLVHGGDMVHSLAPAEWFDDHAPAGAVLVGGPGAISRWVSIQIAQQLR